MDDLCAIALASQQTNAALERECPCGFRGNAEAMADHLPCPLAENRQLYRGFADGRREELRGVAGSESLAKITFPDGKIQEYEGTVPGQERMVAEESATTRITYEGAKGEEAMVTLTTKASGDVTTYVGARGQEAMRLQTTVGEQFGRRVKRITEYAGSKDGERKVKCDRFVQATSGVGECTKLAVSTTYTGEKDAEVRVSKWLPDTGERITYVPKRDGDGTIMRSKTIEHRGEQFEYEAVGGEPALRAYEVQNDLFHLAITYAGEPDREYAVSGVYPRENVKKTFYPVQLPPPMLRVKTVAYDDGSRIEHYAENGDFECLELPDGTRRFFVDDDPALAKRREQYANGDVQEFTGPKGFEVETTFVQNVDHDDAAQPGGAATLRERLEKAGVAWPFGCGRCHYGNGCDRCGNYSYAPGGAPPSKRRRRGDADPSGGA
jgi:hypothetical protein